MTVLVGVSLVLAVVVNLARPAPLPWVAQAPYEIFDDCPEATQTATAVTADKALRRQDSLWVDARSAQEYAVLHVKNARHVAYDPLFPVDEAALTAIKSAGRRWVIVYGSDQTGRLLADDLASAGIPGVVYVEEGFPRLQELAAPMDATGARP